MKRTIKSSETVLIGDKNYLRIFLEKEYPYTIKSGDDEFEVLDFLFEEPNFKDSFELRKIAISLERLCSYETIKSIRTANTFSREALESLRSAEMEDRKELQDSEEDNMDKSDVVRMFLYKTFAMASDYEDETCNTNYYLEMDKFFNFLEKRCFREHNDLVVKNSLSNIDKYNAISLFIKEEIAIEYVSFFFTNFPSK